MWPFGDSIEFFTAKQAAAKEYDYIIVGGGTAGCVLARRLSESDAVSVLLIERGNGADNVLSRNPFFSQDWTVGLNWQSYVEKTVPASKLSDRQVKIVGGRALGGGSRINGMMYTRGVAGEFNEWAQEGRDGWSYEEVEPFFLKSQLCTDTVVEEYQGKSGLWMTKRQDEIHYASSQRSLDASIELGIPYLPDANSPDASPIGISHMNHTATPAGQRHSTYHAFLPQSYRKSHANLTVCTNTLVQKVDVSNSNGQVKATGVFFKAVDGNTVYHVNARKEIILASGALFSPQLLMLSGIGPEDHLREHGIPVLKHLPGVGASLQDHMGIPVEYQVPLNDSWNMFFRKPWMLPIALFEYLIWGKGALTIQYTELVIFMKNELIDKDGNFTPPDEVGGKLDPTDPQNCPDFEIMIIPISDPSYSGFDTSKGGHSFSISFLRPQSTGTVRLKSSDPNDFPAVDLGYMTSEADYKVSRSALRLVMRLAKTLEQSGYDIKPFITPDSFEDEDLDNFVKSQGRSFFHYSSSCCMAPEDQYSGPGVVDNGLRVHGVQGLRIADSSILPRATSAHPMAPVVMIAEKCASMILLQDS